MSHVFISYVRDNNALIDRLCAELRTAGVEVWLDRDSIKAGQMWRRAVREAIQDGAFFIACFSAEYAEKEKTFMNEELALAIDELRQRPAERTWFIPVLVSECEVPDRSIGGGESLRDIQRVSLFEDWNVGIKRILEAVVPHTQRVVGGSREVSEQQILGTAATETGRILKKNILSQRRISVAFYATLTLVTLANCSLLIRILLTSQLSPEWVTGEPVNWFLEFAVLAGIFSAPVMILSTIKVFAEQSFARSLSPLFTVRISFISVSIILLGYLAVIQPMKVKLSVRYGEWAYDEVVQVRVLEPFRGPILMEENYDISLDVRNRTSQPLYVSKIIVTRFNDQANQLLGVPQSEKPVHVGEFYAPLHIQSHGQQTAVIPGNNILPNTAEIQMFHNMKPEPSSFVVDLGGFATDMMCQEPITNSLLSSGYDAKDAIEKGIAYSQKHADSAYVVAAFPGDHVTFLDSKSRLKAIAAENWVVNLCLDIGKTFVVALNDEVQHEQLVDEKCIPYPVKSPSIGSKEALLRANRDNILCGDWKSMRLVRGKVGDDWVSIWQLPYRGPSSLPVQIDATTGHLVKISGFEGLEPIFERTVLLSNITHGESGENPAGSAEPQTAVEDSTGPAEPQPAVEDSTGSAEPQTAVEDSTGATKPQLPDQEIQREVERVEKLFQQGLIDYPQALGMSKESFQQLVDRYVRTVKTAIQQIDGEKVKKWQAQGKDQGEAMALALVNQILGLLHEKFSKDEMNTIGLLYLNEFEGIILTHYYKVEYLSEAEVLILGPLNEQIRTSIASTQ